MSNFRKNQWMYGIIFTLAGFFGLMITMAFIAGSHKENLVIKDYYKAEIEFQKQIDKEKNVAALNAMPEIQLKGRALTMKFREINLANSASGTLYFYRPGNSDKDISKKIETQNGEFNFDCSRLDAGSWRLKIDWSQSGINFYTEKVIKI